MLNIYELEKICTKCGKTFLLTSDHWYRSKKAKDGFNSECKLCTQAAQKIYYRKNSKRICKRTKEWIKAHPEISIASQKKWLEANLEKAAKTNRVGHLRRRYGMTVEDYNQMLMQQHDCCAICGRHANKFKKRLYIDHNHKTGFIRGLLCNYCNHKRIGMLRDDKTAWKGLADYTAKALREDKEWV